MASAREIQSRMQSIKDTMKITSAMYMISSSKMQKAKKSLADTEPFFFAQQNAVARFMKSVPDTNNIFFGRDIPDDQKKRGYLVITADKGLASLQPQCSEACIGTAGKGRTEQTVCGR